MIKTCGTCKEWKACSVPELKNSGVCRIRVRVTNKLAVCGLYKEKEESDESKSGLPDAGEQGLAE